ncbi:MAG: hypothetical protein IPM51_17470 [Sphingobacteriaceae bacterium]|nr:hypothetical protein [Sphingobacteriaceae bacterium]
MVDYRNSKYLVSQWAGLHQIDTIADKETKAYAGIKDITKWEYNNALGENKINLYLINNLGHRLMVKPGKKEDEGGNTSIFGIDKGYHSTYHVAKEFGILKKDSLERQ